jgi:hypothetical protein
MLVNAGFSQWRIQEGSSSFLKKRTKKLLSGSGSTALADVAVRRMDLAKASWFLFSKENCFLLRFALSFP